VDTLTHRSSTKWLLPLPHDYAECLVWAWHHGLCSVEANAILNQHQPFVSVFVPCSFIGEGVQID